MPLVGYDYPISTPDINNPQGMLEDILSGKLPVGRSARDAAILEALRQSQKQEIINQQRATATGLNPAAGRFMNPYIEKQNPDLGGTQGGITSLQQLLDLVNQPQGSEQPIIYGRNPQGQVVATNRGQGALEQLAGGPVTDIKSISGETPQSQKGITADQLEGIAGIGSVLKGSGVPTETSIGILERLLGNQGLPYRIQQQVEAHKIEREQKREEVLDEPLGEKASKYVHKETGERATPDMTRKDVSGRGSNYLALSGTQEKIYEGLNNLKAHADLAESYIDEFPSGGLRTWNNFKMWLRTQANDPQAVALNAQLEAMTPVALSRSLGGSGRGGAILAKMLKEAAFTGGETVDTAKEKLKNMRTLASDLAEANGLPVAPFRGERESTSEERIKVVSPSGKTGTIPASQLEEALKSGYKRAQ